ncbi:MAG TPA: hypothetical protein VI911_11660 [Patescibacteria group bacterium]|nr:hypothetical protein [Patescibacteria group bacterium]
MIIIFKCNNPKCQVEIKKYFKNTTDIPRNLDCGICMMGKMERQLSSPFSKSTEVIDNGLRQRQLEINKDIVESERQKVIEKG